MILKLIILVSLFELRSAYQTYEEPLYQYEYRDEIASDSSHIPLRYHQVRHFPHNNYVEDFGGYNTGGYYPGSVGNTFHHGGYIGGGGYHNGFGGGSVGHSGYDSGNKHVNDESFKKGYGKDSYDAYQDKLGYNQGKIGIVNSQGDSGLYSDEIGGKKQVEDGRAYYGGQFVNQGGENSDKKQQNSIRRKGHVVKGFKNSHHSDETSNNEEYYDEAHDEGDSSNYKGQKGSYKDVGQSSVKGIAANNYYNNGQKQNKGHYDKEEFLSKNNKNEDHFGHNNYLNKGNAYGLNSGFDAQSLLGQQESEDYHKKYHHVPFFIH